MESPMRALALGLSPAMFCEMAGFKSMDETC